MTSVCVNIEGVRDSTDSDAGNGDERAESVLRR